MLLLITTEIRLLMKFPKSSWKMTTRKMRMKNTYKIISKLKIIIRKTWKFLLVAVKLHHHHHHHNHQQVLLAAPSSPHPQVPAESDELEVIMNLFVMPSSHSSPSLEGASSSAAPLLPPAPAPPSASAVEETAPQPRAQARPRVHAPARQVRRAPRNQVLPLQYQRQLHFVDDDCDDLNKW